MFDDNSLALCEGGSPLHVIFSLFRMAYFSFLFAYFFFSVTYSSEQMKGFFYDNDYGFILYLFLHFSYSILDIRKTNCMNVTLTSGIGHWKIKEILKVR